MCRSLSLAEHTKNKVVIMVIVMLSLFLIFNISESIILLSIIFDTSVPVAAVYLVTCCSSSVNALVYGIFNNKYREKLSQLICRGGLQRKPSVEISLKERSVKISLKKIVREPPIDQESTNQTNTTSCNPALNKPEEIVVLQNPMLELRVDNISKGRKLGSNRKKPAIYNQDQNI